MAARSPSRWTQPDCRGQCSADLGTKLCTQIGQVKLKTNKYVELHITEHLNNVWVVPIPVHSVGTALVLL